MTIHCEPVGSTCTLIAELYRQIGITELIPEEDLQRAAAQARVVLDPGAVAGVGRTRPVKESVTEDHPVNAGRLHGRALWN